MHWFYFFANTHKVCSLMTSGADDAIEMIVTLYPDGKETCDVLNSMARHENNFRLPASWIFT